MVRAQAIGRINPDTGELEFQGANRTWIKSGHAVENTGENEAKLVPKHEPTEEKIRQAAFGLSERLAGDTA